MTSKQPSRVVLTKDYLDFKTGIGYPKGTILVRMRSSQYALEGTGLGQECIAGFFLIEDICEPLEPNSDQFQYTS